MRGHLTNIKNEEKNMVCPIPNTHKRLLEVHRLWHQCVDNYFDPEGFRTNLNAVIQALRNLTFALQNEKSAIPEFDSWYAKWQQKMKGDAVLSWLNDARVKIVHQKDLETKSFAKVTIKNYEEIAQLKVELPPFIPSDIIGYQCVKILSEKVSERLIKECYAVVERKWTEDKLPSWELIDAIAYGFNFLNQLVMEAHKMADVELVSCPMKDTLHSLTKEEVITGNYNCMVREQSFRSEIIKLSDFAKVSYDLKEVEFEEQKVKKIKKRYKINEPFIKSDEILKYAEQVNEMAKKVLVKDKYHRQIFMLHSLSNGWKIIDGEVEDKTSKFMFMSYLANIVKEEGIDALIHVGEVWLTSDVEAVSQGIPVVETQNKREALCVTVIDKNNIGKSYTTSFKRGLMGRIILGETVVSDNIKNIYYLNPIRRVWNN